MANENNKDIQIGEAQWIRWVEFDTAGNDIVNVDYIVGKHADFWTFLEINCVAGCCGLEAFRFYPGDIAEASAHIDKDALRKDLAKLKLDLGKSDREIIVSSTLNNLVSKCVFIELLDHIMRCL